MTKRILVLAIALLVLSTESTAAEPLTAELEADYQAALAWWGVAAPPQCVRVDREVFAMEDPYGEGVAGRTTQPSAGTSDRPCFIYLFEPALRQQFPAGCAQEMMMRHEVGHLLGLGHNDDPQSIMSAEGLRDACLATEAREALRSLYAEQRLRCSKWLRGASPRRVARCWATARKMRHHLSSWSA